MQDGAMMGMIPIQNSITANNIDSNLPVTLFSISSTSGKHHESNTDKDTGTTFWFYNFESDNTSADRAPMHNYSKQESIM